MSTLVTGIRHLTTFDPADPERPARRDAAFVVEGERIAWLGDARDAPAADARIDAGDRAVIPGFVDSHTHLVFAGDRVDEFAARMAGVPYAAGGIRTTVAATRDASDEELRSRLARLVAQSHAQGSTTLEIKSGYGLTVADEQRALRLAREITHDTTFLGAHVVPAEWQHDRDGYVDLVCGEMLAAAAPHARFIDVFIDEGAFGVEQARRILQAGADAGLIPKVHAAQSAPDGGTLLAVELGAASVDHGTYLSEADVEALAASASSPNPTVATLLPLVELSTRQPYPDARRLWDAGATVALASDCNPGSNFSSSMPLAVALAVTTMGLTIEEALWAATRGGAAALRRDDRGHLGLGARADFVILDAPDPRYLAYRPGVPQIAEVYRAGARIA